MKGKGAVYLILLAVVAVGINALAYFGIGSEKLFGVGNINLGLDLSGGVSIVYQADKDVVTDAEMNSATSLIQGRLDRKGWTEAEVSRQGENRIRVEIPGVEDAEAAIKEIGQTAQLSFIDEEGNVLLTGAEVTDAQKEMGDVRKTGISEPYVSLSFSEEGKTLFAEATRNNVDKRIAIVLDDEIISAPTVNSEINDGHAMITGTFTSEGATELAALIKSGSLPFALEVIEMNNVGARLGANAIDTSLVAGIVGIILVLLFMLLLYKGCGIAADWALVIYIGLEIAALSLLNVTLTLPGIAGIVLSVGMAVDANVIIFERIKEELLAGKTIRSSVSSGFSRALPAILDGNITTLIAAGVLFFMGTGALKGFAQTLIIGILISMFTALFITRIIMKAFIALGISSPKYYGVKIKA